MLRPGNLLLLIVLMAALGGCSFAEDKTPVSVEVGAVELLPGETHAIVASGGKEGHLFSSLDPFVATVSKDGVITAQRVGETKVFAMTAGSNAPVRVTVNPSSLLYEKPITDWKLEKQELIDSIGREPHHVSGEIMYYDDPDNPAVEWTKYFTNLDTLRNSEVVVRKLYTDEMLVYLSERYVAADFVQEGFGVIYLNGFKARNIDMGIGLGQSPDNADSWAIRYFPAKFEEDPQINQPQ